MYKIIGANNAEYGPVTSQQVRQWITEGRVNADSLAQAAGETDWKPISTFAEFADIFPPKPFGASTPPPAPAPFPSPPAFHPGPANFGDRDAALSEVSGPAIALIIVGVVGILYGVLSIVLYLFGTAIGGMNHNVNFAFNNGSFNFNNGGPNPQFINMMQGVNGAVGVLFGIVHLALGGFTIYAGTKMKALEKHGLCMVAAILAVVPCISPCCCIGIPLGIWAIVVLSKPEVKAHFN